MHDEEKPSILVVDDVAEDLSLMTRKLHQCKVLNPIVGLSGGDDCIDWFKRNGSHFPVLVLLDLIMYPTNGLNVLQTLRDMGILDRLTVVMLSGIRDVKMIHQGYQLGAQTFLVKPVNCEDIMQMMGALKNLRVEDTAEGYVLRFAGAGARDARNQTAFINRAGEFRA